MEGQGWLRARLALMMGLIYAVQGAFWPVLALHLADLGIDERSRGWIFATQSIASFLVSLGAGQLVDRYLPTQKYLAGAFAFGTLVLVALAMGWVAGTAPLIGLFLAYWAILAPCYALSNSLAFRNLPRPDRDFAWVRLWGTMGWLLVGWAVSLAMAWSNAQGATRGVAEAFWIAAGFSAITSAYCWTLPHTPPIAVVGRQNSWIWDVRELAKTPGMSAYLVAALLVSLTPPFVYQVLPQYLRAVGMDRAWVPWAMSLGQWPEVLGLAVLPWMVRRWGVRATLAIGASAYAIRFASLVVDPPLWLATAGIPLHGVGVACFAIAGQMFVNSRAPADRRASAQAINSVTTGGLGALAGNLMASEAVNWSGDRAGLAFGVPALLNAAAVGWLFWRFRADPARASACSRTGGLRPSTSASP